ncbi:putative 2,3-dihydroxybenzoate-AMP ligase [Burkholderia lata]|uniref:2,3-dihydroxybenzoate-AMP ligase n=1 Tax=Burkholderia lata (strain ATCC 17760 / DSM 23089 / LMG 22485 / NCIMB 9086 / R18194 / 383) TaxID=482957 RepID=A0A833PPX2_BURL3|nr:AMP-binding protein [Burkholderia lata]KAF1037114.1 MAG: 2,3-dihydroxybenzoate-AMP ligase [Burkholderia lata]VWB51935.1 putative 2,3-dihydroxybenzoate-AMP ligase [Burkholderia lata]
METRVEHPIAGVVYPSTARAEAALASGAWIASTVGDTLRATAARHPQRTAFISNERAISFAELDESTERLGAALLALGLAPGDRAIFQLGTTIETAVVLLACFKAGIVPVCSLAQHREVEIGQLTRQSGARGYFVQADFGSSFDLPAFAESMVARHPSLEHLVIVRGERAGAHGMQALIDGMPLAQATERLAGVSIGLADVLSFQLSGGTTGVPKIIPRFHAEYLGHSAGWMQRYCVDADSRLIWSLPLMHNAGQLYALIPAVLIGMPVVLMPKVDIPGMLDLIGRHRVTHALSIGPIAPQLMAYPHIAQHDLSSLKLFATMSRADTLEAHLQVPCSNLYGITEGLLLGSPAGASVDARHRTQGCSGWTDDEIRVLEPGTERAVAEGAMGELCFRGPSTLTGYFDNPEANAQSFTSDGFYRTGDIVTAHRIDGRLHYAFEGRLRDNVNRGGEKIGCEEVEGYVSQHPAVADAKLVPMPDPFYGEKGCIFIIPRPGMPAPDVQALAQFLVERGLAKYKCPERVQVVDEFPVTRVGKVDKPAMKRAIAELLELETKQ